MTLGGSTTRANLLDAATTAFSRVGFDGASVRDIERNADAERGLVVYHFGSKDQLWKEVMSSLMEAFHNEMMRYRHLLRLVSAEERGKVLLQAHIDFSATHPEMLRIFVLEGNEESERMRWLVETYLANVMTFFHTLSETEGAISPTTLAIWHYVIVGASATIFALTAQSRQLFGLDPTAPDVLADFRWRLVLVPFNGLLTQQPMHAEPTR